jgi:hypothetical protein
MIPPTTLKVKLMTTLTTPINQNTITLVTPRKDILATPITPNGLEVISYYFFKPFKITNKK